MPDHPAPAPSDAAAPTTGHPVGLPSGLPGAAPPPGALAPEASARAPLVRPRMGQGLPFDGLTVLVVEDSRYASEAIRLMCLRSGARIRRADSLQAAHRHLSVYRPTVVVADLGLPDGPGEMLIAELSRARPRVPVILGMSGDPGGEVTAIGAGADGFLAKPVDSLAAFQEAILSRLPLGEGPRRPGPPVDAAVEPDPLALTDDLALVAGLLRGQVAGETLDYIAQFLAGVGKVAGDVPLEAAARALGRARLSGRPGKDERAELARLVEARLADGTPI